MAAVKTIGIIMDNMLSLEFELKIMKILSIFHRICLLQILTPVSFLRNEVFTWLFLCHLFSLTIRSLLVTPTCRRALAHLAY